MRSGVVEIATIRCGAQTGFMTGLILLLSATYALAFEAKVRSEPRDLTPFTLEDQSGKPFTNASLNGHWTLVSIGFTSCPDICPMVLANLASVLEELSIRVSPGKLPEVVMLAVDPARDKPVLKQYVASFNPEFVGITGEQDQIGRLVESLEGFYRITQSPGSSEPEVQHSAIVSVVDPQGRLVASMLPPLDPAQAATFLAGLIRSHPPKAG